MDSKIPNFNDAFIKWNIQQTFLNLGEIFPYYFARITTFRV